MCHSFNFQQVLVPALKDIIQSAVVVFNSVADSPGVLLKSTAVPHCQFLIQ